MFPHFQKKAIIEENLQIQTYGQRIYKDQTFYEYLLEFLLVFMSPKELSNPEDNGFNLVITGDQQLTYYPSPRMGLKRFIFFSRSSHDKRFDVDTDSLREHRNILKNEMNLDSVEYNKDFVLDIIQDLFYGFNAVIGKRSWFAQSLLPVAPELIFCEAIGRKNARKNLELTDESDQKFNFNDRVFMARGGEVYYLHVVQCISQYPHFKEKIESELTNLITQFKPLSSIATGIQNIWMKANGNNQIIRENDSLNYIKKDCEWIPAEYGLRAEKTCEEISNLLSSKIDPLKKIDLFGTLIIIQLLRLMCDQASIKLKYSKPLGWLLDIKKVPNSHVRQQAVQLYKIAEESLFQAVHTANFESYYQRWKSNVDRDTAKLKALEEASKDTNKLLRKLGKEIGLVIPVTGKDMRFSVNELLVKVLVLTLVRPGQKILFSTFLEKCYEHYGIIIGQAEAIMHFDDKENLDLTDYDLNEFEFLKLMKNSGFVKDLSDATAIVANPFR